uniref:Lysozyme n=1 Tax=Candidatus Kentrum sp. SD TaxID=2126332 RepID=A0A450YWU4_9GAMM|nr:MAG: Phage-related lysozyme (muramidase), GH24 family [Candidatus Kentron sp. SD]VFK46051.1 MAG: Phage-related lysozyme (muramidase), GH24 family [Candidatus Kentron sp. SD]
MIGTGLDTYLAELPRFDSLLRAAGIDVASDIWIEIRELLLRLDREGGLPEREDLLPLFVPLLCRHPEEQKRFEEIFDHWRIRTRARTTEPDALNHAMPRSTPARGKTEPEKGEKRSHPMQRSDPVPREPFQLRNRPRKIVIVFGVLFAVGLSWWGIARDFEKEIVESEKEQMIRISVLAASEDAGQQPAQKLPKVANTYYLQKTLRPLPPRAFRQHPQLPPLVLGKLYATGFLLPGLPFLLALIWLVWRWRRYLPYSPIFWNYILAALMPSPYQRSDPALDADFVDRLPELRRIPALARATFGVLLLAGVLGAGIWALWRGTPYWEWNLRSWSEDCLLERWIAGNAKHRFAIVGRNTSMEDWVARKSTTRQDGAESSGVAPITLGYARLDRPAEQSTAPKGTGVNSGAPGDNPSTVSNGTSAGSSAPRGNRKSTLRQALRETLLVFGFTEIRLKPKVEQRLVRGADAMAGIEHGASTRQNFGNFVFPIHEHGKSPTSSVRNPEPRHTILLGPNADRKAAENIAARLAWLAWQQPKTITEFTSNSALVPPNVILARLAPNPTPDSSVFFQDDSAMKASPEQKKIFTDPDKLAAAMEEFYGRNDRGKGKDSALKSVTAPLRKVYDKGVGLIKLFEGSKSKPYTDSAGHCTIGYGHLIKLAPCDGAEPEEFKKGITKDQQIQILRADLAIAERAVMELVDVDLTDGQYAALCSFVFSVGHKRFRNSTLRKRINAQEYEEIPSQFRLWVWGGGKKLPTLLKRREKEIELFFEGMEMSFQSMEFATP